MKIGPIPKGTPINLLANLEPDLGDLVAIEGEARRGASRDSRREIFRSAKRPRELTKAVPELIAANKCPDFIEDRGHYYRHADLPDEDKRALIEFLKTL